MSTDEVYDELSLMFSEQEDEESSSSSSSSDEEEVESTETASEWCATGSQPEFPFTNIGQMNVGPAESPIDFFKLFFNTTFMAVLVSSINTHAVQVLLESAHENSRINNWKDTNVDEMFVFIGILLHMGHIKLNRINDYWKQEAIFNLSFPNFMSRDRFLLILRNFSFVDPNLSFNTTDPNRFVKALFDFFNNLMKTLVLPPKNLTIDESVVLWRGRLKIKQYIQGKRHKYGVKLYVLTDTTGITQKMHMYCGSHDTVLRGKGHAEKVVMLLMEDYLNEGHSLYMDNFYNSVSLAEHLLDKKTYLTGTLRANRSRNPIITKSKLKKGEILTRYNSKGVCVTNFKDKRHVLMISTEHKSNFVEHANKRGEMLTKPNVIVQYNKYMKGVDRKDQLLAYYPCYNKSTRWYKKILIHVMQVMILNAFMLYKQQRRQSNNTVMSFYEFRLEVVRNLLKTNPFNIRTGRPSNSKIKTESGEEIHLPKHLPPNKNNKTMRKDCRHCLQVKKKRKATVFCCSVCPNSPGLCLECFKDFHNY